MFSYTKAGNKYGVSVIEWLQDTRLMSEACFRLCEDYKQTGDVIFNPQSWEHVNRKSEATNQQFKIFPEPLSHRTAGLMKSLWRSQFIFLESLWEEYLQDLVLELRHEDASIFEPFCEQKFMVNLVRDVLSGELESIEEIKDEAASRFAAGLTRQSWKDQWAQLRRLGVGLNSSDESLFWFKCLDTYFEMRNCIIHRQSSVSPLLRQKDQWYADNPKVDQIVLWPQHLDFYRRRFEDCIEYMEAKINARFT